LVEVKKGERFDDMIGLIDGLIPGLEGPPELVLRGDPRRIWPTIAAGIGFSVAWSDLERRWPLVSGMLGAVSGFSWAVGATSGAVDGM
jgi:uncharacterized membrane protein YhiD involved in acid resistance